MRWRLSGRINLPFNPPIKPYVVTTTFERDSGKHMDGCTAHVQVFRMNNYFDALPYRERFTRFRWPEFGVRAASWPLSSCSHPWTRRPSRARARHQLCQYPEGLLSTQRDEFAIAGWDILLHAVFPGHPFGAEPAPPVESVNA